MPLGREKERSEMSEWHKIENAPRDKTPVLLFLPSKDVGSSRYGPSQCVGYKDGDYDWQLTETGGYAVDADVWPEPTHWMPLPEPPKQD